MKTPFFAKVSMGIAQMAMLFSAMVVPLQAQQNGLLREYWSGIAGTEVSNLTSNTNYPNNPVSRSIISTFEGPQNAGDNYGVRIRGYVVAPTGGSYTFWIASDDNSELWISTNDNPANKTLAASVSGYTNPREWTKYPSQQSTPRTLTAGQRYYVEVLYKEAGGNDNVAVGWQGPGITGDAERPIPQSRLIPYELGLLREVWTGISGSAITDLTSNANYPNSPNTSERIYPFETATNVGDNYGQRLRGYIIPPTTGSYTFWIASDDHSELWLSTSDNPANKTLTASVSGYTNSREWTKYSSQQSTARTLTAGQKYYVEVLHKEAGGSDNCAIGWQGPGITGDAERPIPANRLLAWTGGAQTYSLTVNNDGHGTTSPSGTVTVNAGTATPISATPSTGYQFLNWTVTAGTATIANPSSASTTVTLTSGNATIQANFTLLAYVLTMSNDGNGTTTPPAGPVTVNHGAATSISATPSTGYRFLNWTVTTGTATIANPSSASTTVTLTSGNATIRANFTANTYVLTMSNDGFGTTTPPAGPVTVNHGVATPISATPTAGYRFLNWTVTAGTATIADPSSASTTVILTSGNATIRANFTAITYVLTMSDDGNGTTTPPAGPVTVNHGAATLISATPSTGYRFLNWTVTAGTATIAEPSSASTTVTLTSGNATIRANFTALTYILTMSNDGNGTTTPPAGPVTVNHGAATTIKAVPSIGYAFQGWTVTVGTAAIANPSSDSTTVILTAGNATIRANFSQQIDTLTLSSGGNGSTVPSGRVAVGRGVPTSVTATPDAGFHFVDWTVLSGTARIADPTAAATTVTLTAGNAAIRANFSVDLPVLPNSRQIAVTGTLYDRDGNPVGSPNPVTVEMTVRLCSQATGGDTLYTENFLIANNQGITVDKGLFVVRLGSGVASADLLSVITSNQNLFAQITVLGAQPDVLLPRTPLNASPYALHVPSAAAIQDKTLHGHGNPVDLSIEAAVGSYYINDDDGTTWVKIKSGWRKMD